LLVVVGWPTVLALRFVVKGTVEMRGGRYQAIGGGIGGGIEGVVVVGGPVGGIWKLVVVLLIGGRR
jgi:hypothetical protein